MEYIYQIIIALITTSLGSILAYLKAIKQTDSKIKEVKINADNEIKKIREESKRELDKIRTENEENIKSKLVENELNLKNKEENLKYEVIAPFIQKIIEDPKKGAETIKELQKLSNKISTKK